MRSYIFTARERRLLKRWLEEGEEIQDTRDTFTKIRRNLPQIRRDVKLMLRVVRELQRQRRWRRRLRMPQASGSA